MRKLDPANPLVFAGVMLFTLLVCVGASTSGPITVAVVFCVGAALLFAGNLDVEDKSDRNRT